jgi:endonuclease/exonuclease/phosphatase family metal-dependent hydrolase
LGLRGTLRILILAAGALPAAAGDAVPADFPSVRVATFNCSLNRATEGELIRSLSTPGDAQARAVAEIIRRVNPDILLLQEFDYDAQGEALRLFQTHYLVSEVQGLRPAWFPYSYVAPSNTGVPSGFDLDHDGSIGGGGDALGFGEFPGQYGMAVLSKFRIDTAAVRTFRKFLWRDMPGALLPDDPAPPAPGDWYTPEMLAVLPLSSKSHWDVPVILDAKYTLHLLASHPTPPAFDGPEDRNGRRNHDEVRFWADYLVPRKSRYLRDDAGRSGGFAGGKFVILGDLNSDPVDGESLHDAIRALLDHRRIDAAYVPRSAGAIEASALQGGANAAHRGEPAADTADFDDRRAGNLRVDYLLRSKGLRVCGGGVFWPRRADPTAKLVWGDKPPPSSDHRLVWMDLSAAGAPCPPGSDPTTSDPSRPGR